MPPPLYELLTRLATKRLLTSDEQRLAQLLLVAQARLVPLALCRCLRRMLPCLTAAAVAARRSDGRVGRCARERPGGDLSAQSLQLPQAQTLVVDIAGLCDVTQSSPLPEGRKLVRVGEAPLFSVDGRQDVDEAAVLTPPLPLARRQTPSPLSSPQPSPPAYPSPPGASRSFARPPGQGPRPELAPIIRPQTVGTAAVSLTAPPAQRCSRIGSARSCPPCRFEHAP